MSERKVPFCLPSIGEEEIKEVTETLKSGWLTTGLKAKLFEEKLQAYNKVGNAIAVNSCTSALHLSMAVSGIKKGDEVITSPITYCSTVNAILYQGARPVLADIDEKTFNISASEIEEKVTKKTKAIIAVHYGGQPCDMKAINEIAKKHGLIVVEDAAHALGAELNGKKAGTLADFGCFSFYPIKNITTAEGGAIVTDSNEAAEKLRPLSYCGISKDAWKRYDSTGSWYYEVTTLGYKYNMPDVLASIGLHQIEKLDEFIRQRAKIAEQYNRAFAGSEAITVPFVRQNVKHAWHLYPILLDLGKLKINRGQFIQEMTKRGIGSSVHFIPIHMHPYYRESLGFKQGQFPKAERFFERVITIPIYPKMTGEDVGYVAENILQITNGNKKKGA
ncbi:MAG: DegT/DnrJ/EryC1/StrS family aminotransferase [Candidatus Diapherotrites archaeon]|uniref:DegT/DnrJ/EryC1/StrS family aminotransferase n=1 Tax=Candidatus Iainarchaeum sp. TaxID=3101447 RepID=A0A938YVK7_9ARCH|nr:DegT/DnrJ/EryC1/StrS family aminotransferase [Candidatus Diapherotrites archaeon]